jgi:hypothetical protein
MSHRIVFLDRATISPQIRVQPPSFPHELIERGETRPRPFTYGVEATECWGSRTGASGP